MLFGKLVDNNFYFNYAIKQWWTYWWAWLTSYQFLLQQNSYWTVLNWTVKNVISYFQTMYRTYCNKKQSITAHFPPGQKIKVWFCDTDISGQEKSSRVVHHVLKGNLILIIPSRGEGDKSVSETLSCKT